MWENYQNKEQAYTNLRLSNWLFKVFSFPSTLNDWLNLDVNIRNSELISIFKSRLLSFIRPVQSNIYNIFDLQWLKFLTRLCLGLSHLNEHRFRIIFKSAWITYILVVWRSKMHHITYCTAIIFPTIALILWIV